MKLTLALVGCGKMGRAVEELAAARGLPIVARFTRGRPLTAADARAELPGKPVLIDFSVPEAVLHTVRAAAELSLPLVIGTTGWQEQRAAVRATAESAGIGVVWASNFALGVQLFYRVVERAAALLAPLAPSPASDAAGYDPFILDWHHRFKLDSPSGTAIEMQRRMAPAYGGRRVPVTSLRAGAIPSAHAAGFDSAADTIVLEHRARNRQGLAEGALLAAGWVAGGHPGFHEFGAVLDDLLPAAQVSA